MAEIRVIDNETEPLDSVIFDALDTAQEARIATAFMKRSGLDHIGQHLEKFLTKGGRAQLVYGLDFHITDIGAIRRVMDWAGRYEQFEQYAYSDWSITVGQGFHPKLYIFTSRGGNTTAIVGSSNLTLGGITTNVEVNAVIVGQAGEAPLAQAQAIFERMLKHERLFRPTEGYLVDYESLYERARRLPVGDAPPPELQPEYDRLKERERTLTSAPPTQKRVIIDALKTLPPGPDGYVYWRDIVVKAEEIARQQGADFDWRTFPNSVRGRLNEHTVGKGGQDLFIRKGGVEGREGRYRLSPEGEAYQGR